MYWFWSFYSFIGVFMTRRFPKAKNNHNYAIMIAARNESAVIGNLIDNAFEAMNSMSYDGQKELLFGMFSKPGALLITTDDTGTGIAEEHIEHIFENGFSTKGAGRGTGLYQVKTITENAGGSVNVESQEGVGTSFTVSFKK